MPLYPSVSELRSRCLLTVISLLYGLCVGVLPMTRGRRRRYLAPTALVREYLVVAGRLPPGRRDSRIVLLRLDRARWVGRTAPLLHPLLHSYGSPKGHCGWYCAEPTTLSIARAVSPSSRGRLGALRCVRNSTSCLPRRVNSVWRSQVHCAFIDRCSRTRPNNSRYATCDVPGRTASLRPR